jgi:hypothetical protein
MSVVAASAPAVGQQVVGAERWIASPTYFAASSKRDRCKAIEVWLTSIREQAQGPGVADVEKSLMETSVEYIWGYAAPAFVPVMGREYSGLTEKERKQIAKDLPDCSKARWVKGLAHPFNMPPDQGDGRSLTRAFERYAKGSRKVLVQDSRESRMPHLTRNRLVAYGIETAEPLDKTDRYSLFLRSCSGGTASVVMLFTVNAGERIVNDDAYWARFEREVLPPVRKRCAARQVDVVHHVEGYYINTRVGPLESVTNTKAEVGPSGEFSSASFAVGSSTRSWKYGNRALYEAGVDANASNASIQGLQLAALGADERGQRDRALDAAERRNVQAYEEKRTAILRQLAAEIEARRRDLAGQRAKAGLPLQLVQTRSGRPAAGAYSFSGYANGEVLQRIYDGRFEELVPVVLPEFLLSQPAKVMAEQERDLTLALTYIRFHEVYGEVCATDPDLPSSKVTLTLESVTAQMVGGTPVVTGGGQVGSKTFVLRDPYIERFTALMDNISSGSPMQIMFRNLGVRGNEISAGVKEDSRNFLRAVQCHSPESRQLEVNLHLLFNGLLPLQELRG